MGNHCCTSLELQHNYEDKLNSLFDNIPLKSTDLELIVDEISQLGVKDKFVLDFKAKDTNTEQNELKANQEEEIKRKIQNYQKEIKLTNSKTSINIIPENDDYIHEQAYKEVFFLDNKFLTITNFQKFVHKYCISDNEKIKDFLINYYSEWYKLFPYNLKHIGFKIIFGLLSKQPYFNSKDIFKPPVMLDNNNKRNEKYKDLSDNQQDKNIKQNDDDSNSKPKQDFISNKDLDNKINKDIENQITPTPKEEFNKYFYFISELIKYKLKTENVGNKNSLLLNDDKMKMRFIKNINLFDFLYIYIKGITILTIDHLMIPLLDKNYSLETKEHYKRLWDEKVIIYFIKEKFFKSEGDQLQSYQLIKDFIFDNLPLLTDQNKIRQMLTDYSENTFYLKYGSSIEKFQNNDLKSNNMRK